jgi:hypothetical protein
MRLLAVLVLTASFMLAPSYARACPSCDASRQARSEAFRDRFAENLTVALTPFVVIGAVCAAVEAIGRKGDHQ